MKSTELGFCLGILGSLGALAACGDDPLPASAAERPGPSAAPNPSATPSPGAAPAPSGVPGNGGPLAPDGPPAGAPTPGGSGEGNPVIGGLDDPGEAPAGAAGSGAGPVIPEPTNCVIPTPTAGPVGYGAATTGGGSAAPVLVDSFEEATLALDAYRDAFKDGTASALVLRYTGSFDYSTITDVCAQHTKEAQTLELKQMDNVTFEGAPGSSANFGIHINRAHNVIVRNMTMGLLPGGGDSDAITIEGNGTNGDVENVWIDHNELFSSTKDDCDGAGDTEFDGLIDIKKGARRITISYNFLHDHQKTGLIGFSDDDDTERYVTFHHNKYENVVSRTPLHRFGYVHLFNNYFGNILSSGINVRMGGIALIESNFFENAANPITSRYSDAAGFWDLRNNHVGPGITWTTEDDTLANAEDWQSTAAFPANELGYAYTPDDAACVKQIVNASAGAILPLP